MPVSAANAKEILLTQKTGYLPKTQYFFRSQQMISAWTKTQKSPLTKQRRESQWEKTLI